MYILLIIFHVAVCFVLIAVILLQAGRGGGLAEAFGGGDTARSLLGTQAPAVLKKATEVAAIAFLVTSLALGMVTARRGRSLFDRGRMPIMPISPAQQADTPMAAPKEIPSKAVLPADTEPVADAQTPEAE